MLKEVKPYAAMILLQFGFACSYIIATATLKHGMNHYVLVVYRNAVGAAVIVPFALWFERKTRPKLTPLILLKILGLAVMEPVIDQNFYYMGNKLTSASYAAALYNILPALTFTMALLFRMEKVDLRRRHSQAKVIGTLVTVAGAVLMILYVGPTVEFSWSKGRAHHGTVAAGQRGGGTNYLKGTLLLLVSCMAWSSFLILQTKTLESYPVELSLTTLMCSMGVVLNAVIALVVERGSPKPWIVGWDLRLFTAVYTGVICTGIPYYVQGTVIRERGPVFVTAFNPLCMIITAVMGSIILAEEITLGRIIGAAIIIIGLYSLIWGKSNDHRTSTGNGTKKETETEMPIAASKGTESNFGDEATFMIEMPVTNKNNP